MTFQTEPQNMSDRLITLLTAYTLCTEAISHQRVLKEHVTETMFHAGIISYYSIFKNKKEKQWIKDILTRKKAPIGLKFRVRKALVGVGETSDKIDHALIEVFERFETIRDRNLVHKDPGRGLENKVEWLRIPNGVGDSDIGSGKLYVAHNAFLSLNDDEKSNFVSLVGVTIDIVWQKEEQQIYCIGPNGAMHRVDPPKLNWPE